MIRGVGVLFNEILKIEMKKKPNFKAQKSGKSRTHQLIKTRKIYNRTELFYDNAF